MTHLRVRSWLFIFAVWTLVGLFLTSQAYLIYDRPDRPLPWFNALIPNMMFCYIWALSTPGVVWLSRRYNYADHPVVGFIPVHLLIAVILSIVQSPYYFLVRLMVFPDVPFSWTRPLELVYINLDRQILIYSVILLVTHAFDFYQKYREREIKTAILESQLARAQLQALKMQLRPHFLFNALNSISTLVHDDPEAAERMIARLGDFLRLTLSHSGEQKVPLHEELESVKSYVDIERIRFGERLSLHFEVEAMVLDALVPSFVYQPVVENAIHHGIAGLDTAGAITLRATRDHSRLLLQVEDNGRGLPQGASDRNAIKDGIGFNFMRGTLQKLYGEDYSFDLSAGPAGGLLVTLSIPLERKPATSGKDKAA